MSQQTQTQNSLTLERLESYKYGLKLARERIIAVKREATSKEYAAWAAANKQLREVHERLLLGKATIQEYINAYNNAKTKRSLLILASKEYNKEIAAISRIINGIDAILIPKLLLSLGITPTEPSSEDILFLKTLIKSYTKQ